MGVERTLQASNTSIPGSADEDRGRFIRVDRLCTECLERSSDNITEAG